jgi:hypothetical protein
VWWARQVNNPTAVDDPVVTLHSTNLLRYIEQHAEPTELALPPAHERHAADALALSIAAGKALDLLLKEPAHIYRSTNPSTELTGD